MPHVLDGLHILLVEDNTDARQVMKLIMEYQGAMVVDVPDARTALDLLGTMSPNALVLDINMPDHDGVWLMEEARRLGHLKNVPTVAVSALDPTLARVKAAGFDAYLRKPIEPDDLCLTVQGVARPPRAS